MSKAEHLQKLLEHRIRSGDYLLRELPPERELAAQNGVARMTARKAVQNLVDNGLLVRKDNGRLTINPQMLDGRLRIGYLVPSITSSSVEAWRLHIARAARAFQATVHMLMYVHWDDPNLADALSAFDLVFLYPGSGPIPPHVAKTLHKAGRKLVAVERDLTHLGVRSIQPLPPRAVHQLLDHLAMRGARHIDCLNVQPIDPVIQERIDQWNLWRAAQGYEGELLGDPERPVPLPLERAYLEVKNLLRTGRLRSAALICTTAPAAIGACRALADKGIAVGRDIAVCSVNDESLCRFMVPSITCLLLTEQKEMVRLCLEWMTGGSDGRALPMLLQPSQVPLFVGESTGGDQP